MKILISSRSFDRKSPSLKKLSYYNVVFGPEKKLSEQELLTLADDTIIGIIAGTEQITKHIIDACPNLRIISRYGGGLDNIDTEYAKEKNIRVCSTTSQSTAVAELTVTLILCLLKKITQLNNHCWKPMMANNLSGKTIGIIGYGHVGFKVGELLDNFGCYYKIYDPRYHFDSLEDTLTKSDVITIHVPLNIETKHMISKEQFAMMKPNAILINTSRGGVVDESALYSALKHKKIAGAALDVFETEPYQGKLIEFDNVILTPHIASYTYEAREEMEKETIDNLLEGLE
jgi:D-3-phosphoglycerate dehydrogenase / 2-oxoglutarate reductase